MKKTIITSILAIVLIAFLFPISAYARVSGGTKDIIVGESVQLEAEGPGHTVTGTWSVSGNSCYISSRSNRSCSVTGVRAGTSTVTWIGASDGRMEEIYWTINVTTNGGGSGGGSSNTPDTGFSDSWTSSGNYSISWYEKNKSEYHISTAKELAGVAYLVNNGYTEFEGKTIKLDADIDLSGKNWTTIGDGYNYDFLGAFDGQNHTIKGVYIVSQHEEQQCYGFWAFTSFTTIKNLRIQGKVSIENDKALRNGFNKTNFPGDSFIGGIVGFAHNVYFENCKSDMDIVCKRNHSGQIMLGGIVGQCRMKNEKDIAMRYCSHKGSLYAGEWDGASNPPYIGGLIGYSGLSGGVSGVIEYCENMSDEIFGSQPSSHNGTTYMYIGGLEGGGRSEYRYCRSIVNKIGIVNNSKGTIFFSIGGLGGKNQTFINCYSLIEKCDVNSVEMWYNSGYATIGAITPSSNYNSVANFSNSDMKKYCTITLKDGYDGSTSFSSAQMKTNTFLEEINMYPQMDLGKAIWTADESGYPCVAKTHSDPSGINEVQQDNPSNTVIYTISGQRIDKPRKGINIIGGKKVIMK